MMLKIFDQWRMTTEAPEATGTYADGVFHLTREQSEMQTRPERLRKSYDRDYRAAHRMADSTPVYA
jgi:hypothetical protein